MPVTLKMEWAPAHVLAFAERVETHLAAHGSGGLAAFADEFRATFTAPGVLAAMLNGYLARALERMAFYGDGVVGSDLLTVWYSEQLALRVVKDRSDIAALGPSVPTDVLTNYPSDALVLFLTPTPTRVGWYALAPGADFDRFDASLAIVHEGDVLVEPGTVLHVQARERFPVIHPGAQDLCVVLTGRPNCAQIVSFDPRTLQPLGASMASEISSVLCTMLDVARGAQVPPASDGVVALTHHDDHHVRWSAVGTLWRHHRELALPRVRTLAGDDPHPFVRKAARATLQAMEQTDA